MTEWIASVLFACFRSRLQFNCKLVRYCNIWVSCWTLLSSWSKMSLKFCFPFFTLFLRIASVDFWQTLDFPGPWEGPVELLLWSSEHCYVHVDDNLFVVRWPLLVDVGWVGLLLKVASYDSSCVCHALLFGMTWQTENVLVYSAFPNSADVGIWCYVAEDLLFSQELKFKQ